MRIRSILPKFWESEDVAAMSWDTRLIFIGLWSYVDDNGVGRDSVGLIASDLFPLDMERDAPETLRKVSTALQTLSEGGQIIRYRAEKPLLYVAKWTEYQRVDKPSRNPRYPVPTREYVESPETVATVSGNGGEDVAPGEGEKGRRGEGKKPSSSSVADAPSDQDREDVERLCQHLADRIEQNGSKRPAANASWRRQCRLLLDHDKRTEEQVRAAIDWCQDDPFWRSNILSMPKLREKYDQLRLKASEQKRPHLQPVPARRPFTPAPPPREIEDDPEACDEWYREQARQHEAASA